MYFLFSFSFIEVAILTAELRKIFGKSAVYRVIRLFVDVILLMLYQEAFASSSKTFDNFFESVGHGD